MDREYYNSLQEAYQQVQEQGGSRDPRSQQIKNRNKNQPEWVKNAGNAVNKFFAGNGASQNRQPTRQQQMRNSIRQNRGGGTTPTAPAAPAAPAASTPKVTTPAASTPKVTTPAASTPSAAPARQAAPAPTPKPTAPAATPAKPQEFRTKVTGISPRMDKALSGIGKWSEEELLDYANILVEQNYCDTIESALIVLQHLSPEALDEAMG